MEALLRDSVEQLKKVISFLEKLKVDKKQKSDRDTLVTDLKNAVGRYERELPSVDGDDQTYNDLAAESKLPAAEELYNDVQADTYDDLGEQRTATDENSGIYDDNVEGGMTYDDVPSTQIANTECEKLTNPSIADFVELKKEAGKKLFSKVSWQKRWCVLHKGVLYIYENPKDKRQKEAFWISGYKFKLRDDIKDGKRKERCFELRNNEDKVYEFCAADKDNLTKWQVVLGGPRKNNSVSHSMHEDLNYDDLAADQNQGRGKGGLFAPGKKRPSKMPVKQEDEGFYNDTAPDQDGELYEESMGAGNTTYDDTAQPTYDDTGMDATDADELYEETTSPAPPLPSPAQRQQLPLPPAPGGPMPRRLSARDELPALPASPKPSLGFQLPPPALPQREETGSASGTFARSRPKMPLPGENLDKRDLPPPPLPDAVRAPSPTLPPPPPPEPEFEPDDDDESLEGFGESKDDYFNMYQGIWDCQPDEDNELRFKRGEIIHILSREYEDYGWWTAESRFEEIGLVPISYLMQAFDV